MIETPIDSSLAFTAQLEVRPGLTSDEGAAWRGAMLSAWYDQGKILSLWDFARQYAAGEDDFRAVAADSGKPMRRAVIQRGSTGRPGAREVSRYLPGNYRVCGATEKTVMIEGFDRAGWTFGLYIEPRLASGMIFARETGPDAGEM